ncbi:hypothetical protein GQ457_12G032530 [Hibiscus cannabinus]
MAIQKNAEGICELLPGKVGICELLRMKMRESYFLKANSMSLGCLRSVTVGLPGYNNVGTSTVAPLKRSGTNMIFNYHRKNNAYLRESKERKLAHEGPDRSGHLRRPRRAAQPELDWILTPTGPAQVIQEPKHIYFTGYLVDMMSLNYSAVCVNDDILHTTISLTRVRSHGYVLMAMDIAWFCKSLRALRPIVSLKRSHFTLT